MDNAIVTILVLAYNQEAYIANALDGILSQDTSYKYKVIVTDDASKDNTPSIIQTYIDKNPGVITPVFNEQNTGLTAILRKAIQLIDTKYTCILGGDDYWIDKFKLQKQIDILEGHQEISIVHTAFREYNESDGSNHDRNVNWKWDMPIDRQERVVNFFNSGYVGDYPCASTVCFRSEPFLKCFYEHPFLLDNNVGEGTLLHVSMNMYGNEYFLLKDVTTVYTKRAESMSHFTDMRKYIAFRLDYLNLKIKVFKMFGIPSHKYNHVVANDINSNMVIASVYNVWDEFCRNLSNLDLDANVKKKYENILSSKFYKFVFVSLFRIKRKIFSR